MTEKRKCSAHKKDGTPCGRWPIKGATVCPKHGGSAPQVRRKAQERLLAAADSLMAQLLKIASSAESESVRLAAIRDALDRAGFAPAQLIKLGVGQEDPWGDLLADILADDEILEPVGRRALPRAPRGGGDDARLVAQWAEEDRPSDFDEPPLSLVTPDTIPGEVVRYVEPRPEYAAPSRPREHRISGLLMGGEEAEREVWAAEEHRAEFGLGHSAPPPSDPSAPPAWVREQMDADGEEWRTPGTGRTRLGSTWTR